LTNVHVSSSRTILRYKTLAVLLALAAFAGTLRGAFMFDDRKLIEFNGRIRHWSIRGVEEDFLSDIYQSQASGQYYRPLLTISDRIDYSLWGDHALGFHLTNLLLHMGCVWFLFDLLLLLSGSSLTALFAAALFAAHPLFSDLFLLVTTRSEQMGMLFSLMVILGLLAPRRVRWEVVIPCYLLALFSKESSVITPALAALVFWYQKRAPSVYARLVPLVVMTVPYLWLRHHIVGPIVAVPPSEVGHFLIVSFPSVAIKYGGLILWPTGLHFMRHMPAVLPSSVLYGGLFILLCALMAVGSREGLFCLGWFLLCLLPKMPTLIQEGSMMEHWIYASLMMPVLPLGRWFARAQASKKRIVRTALGSLFALLLVAEVAVCQVTILNRITEEKALRDALQYEPAPILRIKLAILLWHSHRAAEALPLMESTYKEIPSDPLIGEILASIYWDLGETQKALNILQSLASIYPNDPAIQRNLQSARSQALAHLLK
jgi:hypothetical protein